MFLEPFSAQNNFAVVVDLFFACFWFLKFLTQTDHFAKAIAFAWAIALCKMADFQNIDISRIFNFF